MDISLFYLTMKNKNLSINYVTCNGFALISMIGFYGQLDIQDMFDKTIGES